MEQAEVDRPGRVVAPAVGGLLPPQRLVVRAQHVPHHVFTEQQPQVPRSSDTGARTPPMMAARSTVPEGCRGSAVPEPSFQARTVS